MYNAVGGIKCESDGRVRVIVGVLRILILDELKVSSWDKENLDQRTTVSQRIYVSMAAEKSAKPAPPNTMAFMPELRPRTAPENAPAYTEFQMSLRARYCGQKLIISPRSHARATFDDRSSLLTPSMTHSEPA